MVNKDVELLFGEDVRVKVEELLDVALSEEEMKKAFSTTSKERLVLASYMVNTTPSVSN